MIGESSGVPTLINNERINRENQVRSENSSTSAEEEPLAGNFSDVTTFSSEALALARNVTAAGGNQEEQQLESQDGGQAQNQSNGPRRLDIRV